MSKETVKVFSCELRHGGNIMHSLPMARVTSREMKLLKAIHGPDGVVNINEVGTAEVDPQIEAYELAVKYARDTQDPAQGAELVERVLHADMEGFETWLRQHKNAEEQRKEARLQEGQQESAMLNAAREAADAKVRAELAEQRRQRVAAA